MDETKKPDLVDIDVPLNPLDRKDKYMILTVNDDSIQVVRGETNRVEPKFAEEFRRKNRMAKERDARKEALEAEMAKNAEKSGAYSQR